MKGALTASAVTTQRGLDIDMRSVLGGPGVKC
jgi:hypothetical protein